MNDALLNYITLTEKIKLNPLSVININISESETLTKLPMFKLNLTGCINLTDIILCNYNISEINLTECINLKSIILNSCECTNELNLTKCINLTDITLHKYNSKSICNNWYNSFIYYNSANFINLTNCINLQDIRLYDTSIIVDLTKCVNLQSLIICNKGAFREQNKMLNQIDLSNCVNLTNFRYEGNDSTNGCNLIDFSKCIKLQSFTSNYNNLNLRLFPDIIDYIGQDKLDNVYHLRQQIKTEERLNKLEEENRLLKIKDDENKKILQQHESLLSFIESKFNNLEAENKELRKIIDELRPTKSAYI